jgi:thioredoxin 1
MISKKALYLPLLLLVSSNIFTAGRRSSHHRAAAPQQTTYRQPAQTYNQPSAAYHEPADDQHVPAHHAQHASGSVSEITSAHELQEALQGHEPTIIYVTGQWCEACTKFMDPVIEKAAAKYGHQVTFKKLDFDNKDLKKEIAKLDIDGLPRILFNKSGRKITVKGHRPEQYFLNQVEQFINNKLQPEQESTTSTSRAKRK